MLQRRWSITSMLKNGGKGDSPSREQAWTKAQSLKMCGSGLGEVAPACSLSTLGSCDRRIAWAQESEVAGSHNTSLNSSLGDTVRPWSPKKKKEKKSDWELDHIRTPPFTLYYPFDPEKFTWTLNFQARVHWHDHSPLWPWTPRLKWSSCFSLLSS